MPRAKFATVQLAARLWKVLQNENLLSLVLQAKAGLCKSLQRSAIVMLPLLCLHGPSMAKLPGLEKWSRSISFYHQPPWPNGQGVGLLIRRLRVRVPQGVIFCAAWQSATSALNGLHSALNPGACSVRAIQHRIMCVEQFMSIRFQIMCIVFVWLYSGCWFRSWQPSKRHHTQVKRKADRPAKHANHCSCKQSHFARVVKGVDLRSTAGNCAWVRTPQVTF